MQNIKCFYYLKGMKDMEKVMSVEEKIRRAEKKYKIIKKADKTNNNMFINIYYFLYYYK